MTAPPWGRVVVVGAIGGRVVEVEVVVVVLDVVVVLVEEVVVVEVVVVVDVGVVVVVVVVWHSPSKQTSLHSNSTYISPPA